MKRTYRNLKAFLEDTGVSQEEFARRMGISQGHVSMIIRGERTPSTRLAIKIAKHARVSISSLVGTSDKAVA